MSRHRTTAKMHRLRDQPKGPRPAEVDGEDANPSEAGKADERAAGPAMPPEALTRETLELRLAAEAAVREVSEQRTADVLARYFKLTLVMVGLNALVAGASVAALFEFATKTQTVVVTAPPSPLPAPAPAAAKAPATTPSVSPAPAAVPASVPTPAPPAPAKLQLLGGPLHHAAKSAPASSSARRARAPVMPAPKRLASLMTKATATDAPEPVHVTERW